MLLEMQDHTAPEALDCYELAAAGTHWLDRWLEFFAPAAAEDAVALLSDAEFLSDIRDEMHRLANTREKAEIVYASLQLAATILAAGASRDAAGFTVSGGRAVAYWRPA